MEIEKENGVSIVAQRNGALLFSTSRGARACRMNFTCCGIAVFANLQPYNAAWPLEAFIQLNLGL